MLYEAASMEERAILDCAARMMAAARTAPKTRGIDHIRTLLVTGVEKDALSAEMRRLADQLDAGFFRRDAANIDAAQAVVLIGTDESPRGLNELCGYCHFANCTDCVTAGAQCVYPPIDVGIALGSAVSVAADARIDNRVLFSAGRAALSLGFMGNGVGLIFAVPLSATGKSPFFDRK